MREPPALPETRLRACLRDAWGIDVASVEFLPLGLDTRAGVYRATAPEGAQWLVKVKSGPLYAPGCRVPAWLSEQGIGEVVAPLATTAGALWASLGEWAVIVYPFIAGDTGWRSVTDAHWETTGRIFRRIHQVSPPPHGVVSLRSEAFNPSVYARPIRAYEERAATSPHLTHPAERALHAIWLERQPTIHTILARMQRLAPVLLRRDLPYVICHADLHPGNLLRDPHG
ncbi:MAG TPA: aminoglycoside phosphotransferase family protein, partial [Ktedonobacterales bacterium]